MMKSPGMKGKSGGRENDQARERKDRAGLSY